MGKPYNFTTEQVIEAIKDTGGIMATIAKKLDDCSWHTARAYTEMNEETKQALSDEEEITIDMAVSTIIESIKAGNTQDAKWYLLCVVE